MTRRALIAFVATVLVATLAPRGVHAETVAPAKDSADVLMRTLLDAIKADDYDLFVGAAPDLRRLHQPDFEALHERYGAMLLKGYKTTRLTTRRERDRTVHVWNLEPAGGREALEITLVMRDGGVLAFVIR